jgi:hypothetical protein
LQRQYTSESGAAWPVTASRHQGVANQSIAEKLSLSRPTILALRNAFVKDGITAVTGIRKRKRRAKVLTPELERKILDATRRILWCSRQAPSSFFRKAMKSALL